MKKYILILLVAFFLISFQEKKATWVAIGDSITYLNEHPDETGNRVSKGYLSGVIEKLPKLNYVNKGFNGWTSGGIAEHIDDLGLVKADIYSVFLGTNDWWSGRPVGTIEDYKNNAGNATVYGSFRIITNKLRKLNSEAKIVLITPMQRADFVYIANAANNAYGSYKPKNGQDLEAFANAVINIGTYEKLPVIDLYHDHALKLSKLIKFKRLKDPKTGNYVNYTFNKSIGILFNPESDEYPYPKEAMALTYDGLHPSDKGNAIIANRLAKVFKSIGF